MQLETPVEGTARPAGDAVLPVLLRDGREHRDRTRMLTESAAGQKALPRGKQGAPGPRGPEGPEGDQGLQGPKGLQGRPGPQGDRGPSGAQGLPGPPGERGNAGAKGDKGQAGPTSPPARAPTGLVPANRIILLLAINLLSVLAMFAFLNQQISAKYAKPKSADRDAGPGELDGAQQEQEQAVQ